MSATNLVPLNFSITINANAETVWHKMLDLETFKIWTTEFGTPSYYEGSWEVGQNILFKSSDESGIAGKITKNEYLKVVEITYQSWLLKGGAVDTESQDSKNAKGTIERYTFTKISDNSTKLEVFAQSQEKFSEFMNDNWPKALAKLKQICEL
jgi:hypothetical protein